MTNISEDRKVVLTALREVPYETTFLLSDAVQDQSIKNRYWFDLPNQWTHQANKDPIIGIRSTSSFESLIGLPSLKFRIGNVSIALLSYLTLYLFLL